MVSPISQKQSAVDLAKSTQPDVWVKKWVDYSSKYGLGYLLSNSSTGVFFNDSTKILMSSDGHTFNYYERKPAFQSNVASGATEKQDVMRTHTLTDYPKELQKKITLLQHFRSYLENNSTKDGGVSSNKNADVEMKDERDPSA